MLSIGEHRTNDYNNPHHNITKCDSSLHLLRHEEKLNEIKALEHKGVLPLPPYPPSTESKYLESLGYLDPGLARSRSLRKNPKIKIQK